MIKIKAKEIKTLFKRKRDNYTRKLKGKKLINYLRNELRSSTTHGLPFTVNTEIHWSERAFWTLSFLFSIAFIFVLLVAQLSRYINAPIVISVEMDYNNWNISYPAITLCPVFKTDDASLAVLINQSEKKTGLNIASYLWSIGSASIESIQRMDLQKAEIIPLIDPKDYANIAAMVFKKLSNTSLTTNTNWPISVEAAMTEMGMCHVINSNVAMFDNPFNWKNKTIPYVKKNIELSVYDKDFFTQIMNYDDVYRVYIHSPDEIILGTTSSYTSDADGFLSFGVQVWSTRVSEEIRSTSLRLRKCRFIDEPISKRYQIYSYNHCLMECRIKIILKLCGCLPHFYKPLDHERICNLAELTCITKYKDDILSLSASEETAWRLNDKDLPSSSRDCGCLSTCETDIYLKDQESFLPHTSVNKLKVGISAYPKVRIIRDIIFSSYDIFLRIGGVVNLCIGTSIISIMELILTIIRIPIYELVRIIKNIKFIELGTSKS